MPASAALVAGLRERGHAAVVSGAGPTVLALCDGVQARARRGGCACSDGRRVPPGACWCRAWPWTVLGWNHSTTADPTASRGPGLRCPASDGRTHRAPSAGTPPRSIPCCARPACRTPSGSVESDASAPSRSDCARSGGATDEFTP
nr:hypothetical protein [Micrococcus luteus]